MLSKGKRLNLKKDFKRVASGKQLETRYLKLFVIFRDNEIPKVGIATSSSVFKKSSDRNRARRLTSAAFESIYANLPAQINIVALPKQGILGVKSGDVLMDLKETLKNEKIIS